MGQGKGAGGRRVGKEGEEKEERREEEEVVTRKRSGKGERKRAT